jgi:uncharacterized protein (DUF2062 family)
MCGRGWPVKNRAAEGCREPKREICCSSQGQVRNFSTMAPAEWIREKINQLLSLEGKSHAIALGLAIGMFFGLIPLWGLKTLLAIGITRLLQGNVAAAAIAVTLHDLILPLLPLLLRWEYQFGYWLLSHPHEFPPSLRLVHHNPAIWFRWSTFLTVGRPLLVGSVVGAAPIGVVTYYLARFLIDRWKRHRTEPPVG